MSYRRHSELERQAWCWLIEFHLVLLRVVLLLEHRLAVLCDEGIHLDVWEMGDGEREEGWFALW